MRVPCFARVFRLSLALLVAASTLLPIAARRTRAATPAAAAKPVARKAASAADSLHLDPAVRSGVLPNGLRYFIRANHRPVARASLRVAVNAGSNLEQDDQHSALCSYSHI